jgi:chaperonin GroES
MATLKPGRGRILVKAVPPEQMTKWGLFLLSGSSNDDAIEAVVEAVGEGEIDERGAVQPIAYAKGEHVLFTKYSGTKLKYDDTEFMVLFETDILATVVPENAL